MSPTAPPRRTAPEPALHRAALAPVRQPAPTARWARRAGAAGLLWAATAAQAVPLTVSVPDPAGADWQVMHLLDGGPPTTVAASIVDAGSGNTGWQIAWHADPVGFSGSWTQVLAMVYTGQLWDPATAGAIDTVALSVSATSLSSTLAGGVSGFSRLVLVQNGFDYSVGSTSQTITAGTHTLSFAQSASDTWASLTPGAPGLDLSTNGAPIAFGVRWSLLSRCTGAAGCNGGSTLSRLDDLSWTVTPVVTAVPEPASALLIALGLGALGGLAARSAAARGARSRRPVSD